ncbi:tRNA-dihydrouridine synthase [Candidatus Falkowbacteria bacterium]|nr:tRNA-dihydrouridine synthase [Candidatus Falkowbacteria bacterium]
MADQQTKDNLNFWADLPRPFFMLAPMADVTDVAFRRIIAKYGKPDVMYTEFVSVDGLCSPQGRPKLLIDLAYSDIERPIVAQIFGSKPENFFQVAQLIKTLGFDGIDINMGCPEQSINRKQCAGAELIRHPELAAEIVAATKAGAGGLPVSIKTRIGYFQDDTATWIPALLKMQPKALIIHGRTKKDMSKVPARWSSIGRAVELARGSGVLIVGNGDVNSLAEAKAKVAEFGVDGVMIGRGIFGNPWLFTGRSGSETPLPQKLAVMVEHAYLFEELLGQHKPFAIMKKHFKAYVSDFPHARELRAGLMAVKSAAEAEVLVQRELQFKNRPTD